MATKQLQPHTKENLRTSTAQKRTANQTAPANPGMRHTIILAEHGKPELLAHGVSKTQSNRILGNDQVGEVHGGSAVTPIKPHSQPGNVPIHPSQDAQPRTGDEATAHYVPGVGQCDNN
jgi:hypothetical protein